MKWALCVLVLAACGDSSTTSDAALDAPVEAGTGAKANGTLGAWQTLAPLTHARANFCATVVGSYVVAIGGNYPSDAGFTKLDEIAVAKFHDDGTLDAWQVAGHVPSPVTECTAGASGNTLYVVDGIYDDASKEGHVLSADLASDGTLGALVDSGTLPAGVDAFDDLAFFAAGHVWSTVSLLSGSCGLIGGPSAWTETDFFSEFRGRPQWASAVGGVTVTDLPKPTTFGMATSADDWVFVLGGRAQVFAGPPSAEVVAARAGPNGALGAWTTLAPLPSPRTNAVAVVAGNFLYVLGGANTSATDTVFAARVRF